MNSAFYLFTNGVALGFESCATIAEGIVFGDCEGVRGKSRARSSHWRNDFRAAVLQRPLFQQPPFRSCRRSRASSVQQPCRVSCFCRSHVCGPGVFLGSRCSRRCEEQRALNRFGAYGSRRCRVFNAGNRRRGSDVRKRCMCRNRIFGAAHLLVGYVFQRHRFRCAYRGWGGICVFVRVEFDPLAFWRRRSRAHDGGVSSRFLRGVAFA